MYGVNNTPPFRGGVMNFVSLHVVGYVCFPFFPVLCCLVLDLLWVP